MKKKQNKINKIQLIHNNKNKNWQEGQKKIIKTLYKNNHLYQNKLYNNRIKYKSPHLQMQQLKNNNNHKNLK